FLGVKSWESGNRTSLVIDTEVIRCLGTEPSLLECEFENVNCTNDIVQLTCSDVGIRFKGSVVEYAGRVEIYESHTWWTVCDDYWSINDANAACRMAGYSEAIKAYGYSAFGEGTDPIIANDFHCSGEENSLWDCRSTEHRDGYCRHYEDASLSCSTKFVRLSDGSQPSAGRVEVFISGQWGTVCDDNWDMDDAKVVCRQLGFTNAIASYGSARYSPGIGSIHLDEVQCSGNETDLLLCKSSRTHDCEHSEDASVSCAVGMEKIIISLLNSQIITQIRRLIFQIISN
ncbi:scavenger receptor cysteine-rich type 1 protein M130-like, partial [Antedon mediterranea]|uniref:scavenger receptor cysteine-rich type 1 protein M130-like n=1 Tax=Antedon mediterranea TaxID=105859 RepID=UPI003AF81193